MGRLSCLLAGLLALSTLPVGAQQVITFDDVANGTDIRAHYPGLTFSCEGARCANASVWARTAPPTSNPPSAPNIVSPVQSFAAGVADATGYVRIDLASPGNSVTVEARTVPLPEALTPVQHATLIAMDAAGTIVGQATGTGTTAFETLMVTTSSNAIARVILGLSNEPNKSVALFDDLRIGRDTGKTYYGSRAAMLWILFGIATLVVAATAYYRRRKP